MDYFRKHKKGIIGTVIFHVIVLILLFVLGFFTPLPLPGEEGILVNFGTSDRGLGEIEPAPARNNPAPAQPVQREEKKENPPPVSKPVTSPPKSTPPQQAKEVAMTQDYEKTAAIDAAEAKKKEEEKKRQQQIAEEKRQQQIREEQKRREEEERIRKQQEEAERIRKEEEARKAKEAEERRKINEINSTVQNAFANSGNGSGGQGSGTGKSQGATFPGGNQGVPTGGNSGNYGQGGSGSGNSGTGPSFSLEGRSALSLPVPNYPGDDEGTVVVKIIVDKTGKVTSAEPGVRGTTIMNPRLLNEAKQAALRAKFNPSENAPAFQQGTISYKFVLN